MDDERGGKEGAIMLPCGHIRNMRHHACVSHIHAAHYTHSLYGPRVASLLSQKKLKYLVLEEKVKARARLGLGPAGASFVVLFGWWIVGEVGGS